MATGGPLPFLEVSGVEVSNAARTLSYLRAGLADTNQGHWELGSGELCSVLYRTSGTPSTFVSPAADPAPWYDADESGSTDFLGLVLLDMQGYDSTLYRAVTNKIQGLGGATFSKQQRYPRIWKFRGAMVSASDAGAEYGLRWLTQVLQASECDTCEAGNLSVRLVCPPANGSDDDLGLWTSYDVALTDGPHEVAPYSPRADTEDPDVLAGCRDYVIVEFTLTAGNPFLYKAAEDLAVAEIGGVAECTDICSFLFGSGTPVSVAVSLPTMGIEAAIFEIESPSGMGGVLLRAYSSADCGCAEIVGGSVDASGNEITDAERVAAVQGDGLTPPAGYGIWEGTTDRCTNGGFETGTAGWSVGNNDSYTDPGGAISQDATHSKFGSKSCRLAADGTFPQQGIRRSIGASVLGQRYTASAWVLAPVGHTVGIALGDNVGSTVSASAASTGAWQRVKVSWTSTGNTMFVWVALVDAAITNVYIDGVQVEQKPIATPYVETDGATASRGDCLVQDSALLLDEAQGWVAVRLRPGWDSTLPPNGSPVAFEWWDGSGAQNKLSLYRSGTTHWEVGFVRGSVAGTVAAANDSFSSGDGVTLIVAWTGTHVLLSVNGAAFASAARAAAAGGTALLDVFSIGSRLTGSTPSLWIDSNVRWVTAGLGVLANADAAAFYALGDEAPDCADDLHFAMETTLVWDCVTTAVVDPATPELEIELSAIAADSLVTVDCSRRQVTVEDLATGAVSDGTSLIVLAAGKGIEWIEWADCDDVGCVSAAPSSICGQGGTATVTIQQQRREG